MREPRTRPAGMVQRAVEELALDRRVGIAVWEKA